MNILARIQIISEPNSFGDRFDSETRANFIWGWA